MNDMTPFVPQLHGMTPAQLAVRSTKIQLEGLEVQTDIGFHEFEVGNPQRLLVSVEIWLTSNALPEGDRWENAWNYDDLKCEIERIAVSRRFNLQETLAREIYDWVTARAGVRAVRVRTSKPDVYSNAKAVGVEIASFSGGAP